MAFNSLQFLFFFGFLFVLYYALPDRYRPLLLLAASFYFYMAFVPVYILVLLFLIVTGYLLAKKIEMAEGAERKRFLIISIFANLSILFVFKYFNFFNANVAEIANLLHWNYGIRALQIALPLGLSFHMFQNLAYVIEVYYGRFRAEQHLGKYALYIMFFPQLVAGPIERPQHMLPQFHQPHDFRSANVTRGLQLMLWGFFKKLVIADRVAPFVDKFYGNIPGVEGPLLTLAIILFAYQLYCDFSGYSDIAVGAALVFGYDLMNNFNRPYASKSIREFWRRWHISLSSWLRDYLYIPLGGSREGERKMYFNLMVTMLLGGLWHGAAWTFVIWGALHGFYLSFASMTSTWRRSLIEKIGLLKFPKFYTAWQAVVTFILVAMGWVFFRAQSLHEAIYILGHAGTNWIKVFDMNYLKHLDSYLAAVSLSKKSLLIAVIAIVVMEIVQKIQKDGALFHIFETRSRPVRWAWYYALVLTVFIFGYFGSTTFIYFQF